VAPSIGIVGVVIAALVAALAISASAAPVEDYDYTARNEETNKYATVSVDTFKDGSSNVIFRLVDENLGSGPINFEAYTHTITGWDQTPSKRLTECIPQ